MIPVLIEAGLRALVVAIAVGTGLSFLRIRNVLAQKACWGLVLAAAFVMPAAMHWQWVPAFVAIRVPLPIPAAKDVLSPGRAQNTDAFQDSQLNSLPGSQATEGADRFPAPTLSQSKFAPAHDGTIESAPKGALNGSARKSAASLWMRDVLKPAKGMWLAAIVIWACLLSRLIFGAAMALKLWISAKPIGSGVAQDLSPKLHVRFSSAVFSPVTIGSGIILPANYSDWDEEKLRIVLAHERSHIRQGDFYLQLLAEFYAALFWFSPLGWWLKRKLSDLGEAISDRAGLEEAVSRTSYAQILLEFAAMPRPTQIGVAMARTSNLSRRIERLLNESNFFQAFAMSRRGLIMAVLLVPAALFVATGLIRVEAASLAVPVAQATTPAPADVQPPPSQAPQAPDALPAPATEPTQQAVPPPPSSPDPGAVGVPVAPVPPASPEVQTEEDSVAPEPPARFSMAVGPGSLKIQTGSSNATGRGYSYSYSSNGDSYALITDSSARVTFSGEWNDKARAGVDKARQLAHGKFLWFTHSGKSYFIDDQGMIAQIEAMYKPMEALGRQQEELGRQQEALGKEQEKLGSQQEQASVPAPDLSKEMAELNAAMAQLQSMKGTSVSREQWAGLQEKIGEIQGRLGELQGKFGEKQGILGALQGNLGEQQGKLGAEQGRLGAEQGRIAAEADQKIKAMINESLGNGKARPLE